MFAGKTTEMLNLTRRYRYGPRACEVSLIRPLTDTRSPDNLVRSHDDIGAPCATTCYLMSYAHTRVLLDSVCDVKPVIGIDEGQFFNDLVEGCMYLVENGYHVYVAALNGTFRRTPWPAISELIPLADKITFLTAICHGCSEPASFTHLTTSKPTGSDIIIGGSEKYHSLCGTCFKKATTE